MNTPSLEISTLSEKQILDAPESDYMNSDQLDFFRKKLLELHQSTQDRIREAKGQVSNKQSNTDPNDCASSEEQLRITLRIVDREQKLLPKIEQSLQRIRTGEYGYCRESGEPIGISRLLARPTAEYCADVKILKEQREQSYKK